MASGLRDSEINTVLRTTTEGDAAFDAYIAKLEAARVAADELGKSTQDMGNSSGLTANEISKLSDFMQRNRDTMSSLRGDIGATNTFLDAMAMSAGMSRDEFDKHSQSLQNDLGLLKAHTTSIDDERGALQRMVQDYKDMQLVSAALGSTIGVSGKEFEQIAAEAINAGDAIGGGRGGGGGGAAGAMGNAGNQANFLTQALAALGGSGIAILVVSIITLTAALAPLVALFLVWLTVTATFLVTFAGVIVAAGIATGLFVAMGAAVGLLADNYFTQAQTAAQNLTTAQQGLTSATVAHDNALRSLQNAQAAVTAGHQASVSQLNSIASAQQQVATTATQVATAQNQVAQAQLAVAQTGPAVTDPLGAIEEHLKSVVLLWGQQAYPMLVQMAQAADNLVAPAQRAGSALITWFGGQLPQLLDVANGFVQILMQSFEMLQPTILAFMSAMLDRSPELMAIFASVNDFAIGAVQGLLNNLLRLTDWFTLNFPNMASIAVDGFNVIGSAVQGFISMWAGMVGWMIDHWPGLEAVAQGFLNVWAFVFASVGQGIQVVAPLIQMIAPIIGLAFGLVADAAEALTQHAQGLRDILMGVGIVLGMTAITIIILVAAIGLIIAAVVALVLGLSIAVDWILTHTGPAFSWLGTKAHELWDAISVAFEGILAVVVSIMDAVYKVFLTIFAIIFGIWFSYYDMIFKLVVSVLGAIFSFIGSIMSQMVEVFRAEWSLVSTVTSSAWTLLWNIIVTGWNAIINFLRPAWNLLVAIFQDVWNFLVSWLSGPLSDIEQMVDNSMKFIHDSITGWLQKARDSVGTIFGDIGTAIGNALSVVGTVVHKWLEDARNILNSFIDVTNKALGLSVADIPDFLAANSNSTVNDTAAGVFAAGGVIAGYAPGQDTVMARLSPGEGILTPQAVRMIGPGTVHALNSAARYADGGIVGSVIAPFEQTATSALRAFTGFEGSLAQGAGMQALNALTSWIGSHAAALLSAFTGSGGAGAPATSSQVLAWIMAAISAAGVGANWVPGLEIIIQNESGGNPLAANLTDINAQAGDPSVGLMQLILSNQTRYGGITSDPVMQIVEGIRYIIDRYGDISNVPGVRSVSAGGPYVPYDTGGILPPGGKAINLSGKNEHILPPGQVPGNTFVFNTVGSLDPQMVREAQRIADWEARTKHH